MAGPPIIQAAPAGAKPISTAQVVSPEEGYTLTASLADVKARWGLPKLFILGILAGAYIGLGFSLCLLVGGQMSAQQREDYPWLFNFLFSIFGFPMGLTLVVVAGADLFTSNCMNIAIGLSEGMFGVLRTLRMLCVSYCTNILGCLMLVGLMCGGDVFDGNKSAFVIELALKKTTYTFQAAFFKAILCNWLVCLSVWNANLARDYTGKFVGIFLPLTAFVAMGFEHIIANMYLLPLSMVLGSGISMGTLVGRMMVPVTLGNLVGGSFFVGCLYALAYGRPGAAVDCAWRRSVSSALARLCSPYILASTAPTHVAAEEGGGGKPGRRADLDDSVRLGCRWGGSSASLAGSQSNLLHPSIPEHT